jgi:uncharacterized damage-inducible protein DinB
MSQNPPIAQTESQPEPWLRGTLTDLTAEQRAVLHALYLAQEDIQRWCGPLTEEELSARPHGLPSVAFQLRHILGSLDRLLTYAEGKALDDEQKRWMAAEMDSPTNRDELMSRFDRGLKAAAVRVRAIPMDRWPEPRGVGRKQLPTTVAGLLIHCADHTQRHVGQAITTAKVLLALRESPSV